MPNSSLLPIVTALRKAGYTPSDAMRRAYHAQSLLHKISTAGAKFSYTKRDGTVRTAYGKPFPVQPLEVTPPAPAKPAHPLVATYYDAEKGASRAFRIDRLIISA